jgi:hypothetical protein
MLVVSKCQNDPLVIAGKGTSSTGGVPVNCSKLIDTVVAQVAVALMGVPET